MLLHPASEVRVVTIYSAVTITIQPTNSVKQICLEHKLRTYYSELETKASIIALSMKQIRFASMVNLQKTFA